LQPQISTPTVRRVPDLQTIRGAFGTVEGFSQLVDDARRERGLTWEELAAPTGKSRQYLRAKLESEAVPIGLLEYLARALNLRPRIRVSGFLSSLLEPAPQ
jgi:ribosome-binding protein aMBF1 (putative translation factor)